MFVFFLGAPDETLLGNVFTVCTCWSSYGYASTIGTLGGSAWLGFCILSGKFSMMVWCCSGFTTLVGLDGEVALSNFLVRFLNASFCMFLSVTSGLSGASFSVHELNLV